MTDKTLPFDLAMITQSSRKGDVNVGHKLGTHLKSAGFVNFQMSARYEVYPSLPLIGEYLALQLDRAGDTASAATLRAWSEQPGGLFAQCWVSCIAYKPSASRASTQRSLMEQFLRPTDVIDRTHSEVLERARAAQRCLETRSRLST